MASYKDELREKAVNFFPSTDVDKLKAYKNLIEQSETELDRIPTFQKSKQMDIELLDELIEETEIEDFFENFITEVRETCEIPLLQEPDLD